jgi:cellulose synthase/poly-beta-1,6-N-acetylglucosamine synthase-like glycosyltransferase
MSVSADTYSNLPVVTLPMPAISLAVGGKRHTPSPLSEGAQADETAGYEGHRWSAWGAARDGARMTLTTRQKIVLGVLGLAIVAGAFTVPYALLLAPIAFITVTYLVSGAYKAITLMRDEQTPDIVATDPYAILDAELPMYTVLVPLYHEGKFAPVLVEQLLRIDYPANRLEVLLLIEHDDEETWAALEECALPHHMHLVNVPIGMPRTKPRALNVGLAWARGKFIVIYDAEDQPEPDQLRKAVATFHALPRRVVCLQARLNFYNRHQTLLTRLFSMDYAVWYDMLLPGMAGKQTIVPLGGTSNHFRVDALRRLGGWDPYNVTEDADLGVRIARARLSVMMLDSVTWEEAVARVPQWVRQRSRWIKGYIQTYLVHMRHPVRLMRQVGPRAFLDFQIMVGGSSLILLVNPLMWVLTVTYFVSKGTALAVMIQSLFPSALYYAALLCLLGNFIFFYCQLYVCVKRGYDDLARYALLGPLYWILMSVGAWAGLVSLLRNPHYWAKTEHGVSLSAKSSVAYRSAVRDVLIGRRAGNAPHLSIVIPAYNEAHRLPVSLERLHTYVEDLATRVEVIVVDDGSSDGTVEVVEDWMQYWPVLQLIQGEHRGKGGAIRTGVLAALGEYVAMADADFSMPASEFDRFSPNVLGPYDVAIGSREVAGAQRLGEPWHRYLMSRVFNRFARFLLVRGINDTQCGFKCLRRDAALDLCAHQTVEGWGFDVELLHIARLRGYRVCEVPIAWRYVKGSRIHPFRDTLAMVGELLAIRVNSWRGRYAERALEHAAWQNKRASELTLVAAASAD